MGGGKGISAEDGRHEMLLHSYSVIFITEKGKSRNSLCGLNDPGLPVPLLVPHARSRFQKQGIA